VGGLPAGIRLLRETLLNEAIELRSNLRPYRRRRRRLDAQYGRRDGRVGVAHKCLPPCRHLVENRAEREDVASVIDGAAITLLG
jgi:hypothetical protein